MAIVNLAAIYGKIRRLTGSDTTAIPDVATSDPTSVGLADYVNSFYNYDLPAQFRSLKLKDKYTFNTTALIDTYAFNSEKYTTVEMPCYCMKREIALFNNPWDFYGCNFNWQSQTNFTFSNGSNGPYSGYTTSTPILRSTYNNPTSIGTPNVPGVSQGAPAFPAQQCQNILITANTSTGTCNVTDDGFGNLIGDVDTSFPAGQINYQTGQISGLYFSSAIPAGNHIQIQYNPIQPTIPLSILFFANQFVLRPVPDQGYTIELVAYRQPTQALMDTPDNAGTPELSELWETLAFGASKKIFQDRLDMDGVAMMEQFLSQAYQLNYTRTYGQLGKQRVNTIYADQLQGGYGHGGFGFGSGGQ